MEKKDSQKSSRKWSSRSLVCTIIMLTVLLLGGAAGFAVQSHVLHAAHAANTPDGGGGGGVPAASLQDIANAYANQQPPPGGYQADGMGFLLYIRLFQPALWGYLIQADGAQNLGWMTRQAEGEAAAFIKNYNVPVTANNISDPNLRKLAFALTQPPAIAGSAFAPGSICGESFTGTTTVATAQGEQQISQLSVGERVWTYDPATQTEELQPVTQVWINHDNDLMNVGLAPAPGTKTETIHTTQDHLWLTMHGWVSSADLHLGDQVLRLSGQPATVTQLQVIPGAQDMYDLTVNQIHTFAVGENQYVVHNCTNEEAVIASILSKSWAQELNINGNQTTIEIGFWTNPNTGETKLVGSMNSASMNSNLATQFASKLQEIDGVYVTTSQGPGQHAEINMLGSPEVTDMDVDGIAGNNYFCNNCGQAVVNRAGGNTAVLGTGWKKAGVSRVTRGYKNPSQFEYIPELEFGEGENIPEGLANPWLL